MFYGNTVLKQQQEEPFEYNIEGSLICESVCMTEWQNRLTVYEACTNESEKAILESQLVVLNEISIKDIGKKIIEALMTLWEHIKKFAAKIKNFITGARIRELKKRAEELEKKVADLEKDNSNLQSKYEKQKEYTDMFKRDFIDKSKESEAYQKSNNKNKEKIKELESELEDRKKSDESNIKIATDALKSINKIAEKVVENKYIYFDQYDYIDQNARRFINIIQSDLIEDVKRGIQNKKYSEETFLNYDPESTDWNDFAHTRKYYILNDKFLNNEKNDILKLHVGGGEASIVRLIEADLEEKAKTEKKKFTPVWGKEKEFFKFISEKLDSLEDENYSDLSFQLGKCVEDCARIAKSFTDKSKEFQITKVDPDTGIQHIPKDEEQSDQFNKIKKTAMYFSMITKCLKANSTFLVGVSTVMGKSVGALGAAVNSCSIVLGMEAIRSKAEQK